MPATTNSRKETMMRAFGVALERLQRGETVVISLGTNEMRAWATARTYWYDWKSTQLSHNPDWSWLYRVKATHTVDAGMQGMKLEPSGPDRSLYVAGAEPRVARVLVYPDTGHLAPQIAAGEASEETKQRWAQTEAHLAWADATGRDITCWPDKLFVHLDPASPQVLALRERLPPQREDTPTYIEAHSNDPQFKETCDWLRSIGIDPIQRSAAAVAASGLMHAISLETTAPRALDTLVDALNTTVKEQSNG